MDNWFTQLIHCAKHGLPKEQWPHKGECECCGARDCWLTHEAVPYSSYMAYVCERCAPDLRKEVAQAWEEYYHGRL